MTSPSTPNLAADREMDLSRPLSPVRLLFSYGMTAIAFGLTGLALLPLLAVLFEILQKGLAGLRWEVFTALPAPAGVEGVPNGFANAIQGTMLMVGVATLGSLPLGMMTGIFLSELGKTSALANTVRFVLRVLSGVPSIVVGVFAYAVMVLPVFAIGEWVLKPKGFSALAGSFALAVVMLPIISLSTEEALKLVPMHQRLASAALGANRFQTIFRVVVSAALPGITTGVLLAVARAAGETAPLIFTALFSQSWLQGLLEPAPALSVLIYRYADAPFPEQIQIAWTASVVLIGLVLVINVVSRVATRKRL
jgi:phosphate transport system permease protein